MEGMNKGTLRYIEDTWNSIRDQYSHYIYFPIEFDAVDDGVRSVDETWRRDVDNSFQERLKDVPHLTVTGSPMQRIDQILNYIK